MNYKPEQWKLTYYGTASAPDYQISEGDNLVCNMAETNIRNAVKIGKYARLIATAPDMLFILKHTLKTLQSNNREVDIWAIQNVINKAEKGV